MWNRIYQFMKVREDQPELNRAIFTSLGNMIPLMYAMVSVNMIALAWTHWSVAPRWLTLTLPIFFTVITFLRSVKFHKHRNTYFSDEEIRKQLQITVFMSGPISAMFMLWEFSLLNYSTGLMQGQVMFFAGVTAFGTAFCLIHLRQAAIIMMMSTIPPTAIFLALYFNQPVHIAVAINMLVVGALAVFIIRGVNNDFAALIAQQTLHGEQKEKLQRLNHDNLKLANTDALTGLPNRRSFYHALDQYICEATETDSQLVVILLDLDGFKPVNDVFGHPAGDALLQAVSERLQSRLGDSGLLSRLGGDEFGILLTDPGTDDEVLALCRELSETLRQPFRLKEGVANIAGTIGIARYPESGRSRGQLFDRADYALCYSKQHSKGEPIFFSEDHEKAIREYATLEQRLREANLENELYMVFQQIMDTRRDKVMAFEALARWQSPTLGNVSAEAFIRSAEQAGLIANMSGVLLDKALAAAMHWPADVCLSFNLSAVNLSSSASVRDILRRVDRSGFSPSRIIFEITESAVMRDFDRVIEALNLIRSTGARIALDDFGTGFSSLSYVQKLPLDRIKVDRSFVQGIDNNLATRKIVETIAILCRNIGIGCIVEGVETSRQMDLVHRMGLTEIQGYFFSKPLDEEEALKFVQSHNSDDDIAWLSA